MSSYIDKLEPNCEGTVSWTGEEVTDTSNSPIQANKETGEREGGIINLNIKLECASSAIA